ncbi:MAG: calcium-binding protein [Actinobacteria bacterium]|nr:calcium-binding protein [Actinomycetota bacterium]
MALSDLYNNNANSGFLYSYYFDNIGLHYRRTVAGGETKETLFSGIPQGACIDTLNTGEFVASWIDAGRIKLRTFDNKGNPKSATIDVGSFTTRNGAGYDYEGGGLAVTGLQDGGFILTYSIPNNSGYGDQRSIWRVFDNSGNEVNSGSYADWQESGGAAHTHQGNLGISIPLGNDSVVALTKGNAWTGNGGRRQIIGATIASRSGLSKDIDFASSKNNDIYQLNGSRLSDGRVAVTYSAYDGANVNLYTTIINTDGSITLPTVRVSSGNGWSGGQYSGAQVLPDENDGGFWVLWNSTNNYKEAVHFGSSLSRQSYVLNIEGDSAILGDNNSISLFSSAKKEVISYDLLGNKLSVSSTPGLALLGSAILLEIPVGGIKPILADANLQIKFSTIPKEGAGEFTTSINLSAGTQSTGNLAEGAHVYWKITGIQQSDLAAGYSLTGDGVITNGKLDFKEALVDDHIKNSKSLSVSVYSDSGYQNQIGTTATTSIQDSINLDIGSTTTTASKTTTLDATTSRLTLTGVGSINGTGNALNNYITGNDGNNILDGGLGNDILAGGKGNDTYIVESIYDTVIENANEGTDLVKSSVNWTLGANVENLTLTGSDNLSGTGNELSNTIVGNYGNNVLDGGAGNDTLEGNSGNDTLIGGLGNDVMKGGAGNDTYYVDSTGDTITDTIGTDTVFASISYTLGTNLENLTLTGTDALTGIGNTYKNTIIGNAGNNVLDGMGGTDSLTGGAGADTFRFSTRPNFGASTADHITDFKASEGDLLQISKSVFGLASDATATVTTVSSATELSTALGSATTFVYDSSNGNLYWNQNGIKSGFGSGGIFAVLDNHSALSSSNISLV